MPRLIMTGVLVFAALWPCALPAQRTGAPATGAAAPVADFPTTVIDLGRVYEQDTYEYVFTVRNRGSANLVIQSVVPGCGCTAAQFDTVIAPLKEGRIRLVIDGHKVEGDFSKQTEVVTNDPSNPKLTLITSGSKIPYVTVSPYGTLYLQGRPGEKVEGTLTVTSNEPGLDFQVTSLTSDMGDKITYKLEAGKRKGEYVVRVKKNPNLTADIEYGSLVIHTNSKHTPEKKVDVQVLTRGSFTVNPAILSFGQVAFGRESAPATPVSRILTITRSSLPFEIKSVSLDNPRFVAVVETVTEGEEYRINVFFTPPVKKAAQQVEKAEMTIRTSDTQEPVVRVAVTARAL